MSSARFWCGSLAVAVALCAASAAGQRVQFPTMVANGAGGATAPSTPSATPPQAAAPSTTPYTRAAPPATTPYRSAPPATTPYTPTPQPSLSAPPGQPAPPATLGGTVQPVPGWDPYSAGGARAPAATAPYYAPPPVGNAGQPPALFPGGVPWGSGGNAYAYSQPSLVAAGRRFLQEVRFEYTWLANNGGNDKLGINELEIFGTFAFPLLGNTDTPLLVTPGFATDFLNGPVTTADNRADMPAHLYDTYIDLAWQPRITPWLSADLGFRTGVYSDFTYVDSRSIRYMGRGLGVVTFTPTTQITLGVVYLDRNKIKLLPAGGLIWTPTPNRRWEIVFPNPKLASRLQDIGTTQWWWYVSGEYGGGSWTVTRADLPLILGSGAKRKDSIDYNDIRVMLGTEWTTLSGMNGFFEIGYVFNREIIYVSRDPVNFNPTETMMLRGGVAF